METLRNDQLQSRTDIITEDIEVLEPFRAFDYLTNDGCWVEGKTPFIVEDNTFLYVVRLDRVENLVFRDPEHLAEWDI